MSTDGPGGSLTRAQLRALRAAEGASPAATENPPAAAPEPERPEARAEEPRPRPARRHAPASTRLLAVLGALVLVVGVLAAISLVQGPRLSRVQIDPAQAIDASGSRLILTVNQPLGAIEPAQVTVEPSVPFTVDASGRDIGIRFTVPLHDSTEYTVTVADVSGAGGGPSSDLSTTFRTPASRILLLQRSEDDDTIFATDLTGENAVPVFRHPRIDDFRVTADRIVVAVSDDDGSRLLVMRRDGSDARELALPGEGYVSSVQVSDRGGLVGYTYSDRELTETEGRASVLVTQPLSGSEEPRIVRVGDAEANIADWQFVPDSSTLLFIDFDGGLAAEDPTAGAGVRSMGLAANILGIARGTYTAIVERTDANVVLLDLMSGEEQPLPASEPDYGEATTIEPFPGGTLRHIVQRDELGMPTGQAVVRVADDGSATIVDEVSGTDAIVQTCVSPSGQYAAVVVAPNLPENPYDDMLLPLPTTLHTRLFDLVGGAELPTLSGFDVSWCRLAPQR